MVKWIIEKANLVSLMIRLIASSMAFVSTEYMSRLIAAPFSSNRIALYSWSTNNGVAMTGFPVVISSYVPLSPQWLITAFTFS